MFSYSSHSTNSHITQTFHRFKTPHAGLKSEWLMRQKWISFSALATLFIFHISVSCSVQLPSVFLHSDSLWLTSARFNQSECVSSDSLIERVDYGSYSEPILSPFKSIKSAITHNNHTGFRLKCVVTYFTVCKSQKWWFLSFSTNSFILLFTDTIKHQRRSTAWNCIQNSCLQICFSAHHKHFNNYLNLTTDP